MGEVALPCIEPAVPLVPAVLPAADESVVPAAVPVLGMLDAVPLLVVSVAVLLP